MNCFTIVVLLSGNGATLQAIIDRIAQQQWPIRIMAIISDNPAAYGLIRGQQAGIPTHSVNPKSFTTRAEYHLALQHCINTYQPDLLVLAGYLRILSAAFIAYYANKIINIHPSLLPKFPGLHTYQQALDAHETEHGTTVHQVTAKLDAGPIIAQAKVAINNNETVASLAAKVKALEQQLYPEVIHAIAQGKISLKIIGP